MTGKRQQAEKRGRMAETAAAWFLRLKGYTIVTERYRSPYGEIDLIATKAHQIVIVEVKTRKTERAARESVGLRQRQRIEKTALHWLAKHGKMDNPVRFDVITIAPGQIPTHIRDAWRPEA